MLINLRNALMAGKRTPTAKDYVQSGLVAMWDGIENAGWGTHTNSIANGWLSLVSGESLVIPDGYEFKNNHMDMSSGVDGALSYFENTVFGNAWLSAMGNRTMTFEVVAEVDADETGGFNDRTRNSICPGNLLYGFVCYNSGSTYFNTNGGGTGNYWLSATGSVGHHHIAGTFSPATDPTHINAALYQDGVLKQTRVSPENYSGTPNFATITTTTWLLGKRKTYNKKPVDRLYCCRVYSRTLSASEIAANYAVDVQRFNLPTT